MGVIAGAGRLALNSRVVGYNTELQMKSNIFDIYTMKTGLYNRENQSWPTDAIKMKVKDTQDSESVITMKENLGLGGVFGQTMATGTEEAPRTKDLRVYQDNYRKVIPVPGYGLLKMEGDRYKLWDKHIDGLGLWAEEQRGVEIRMAVLERYGMNLVNAASNTVAACIPAWNPNIFIPGLGLYNQPAPDQNRAIATNNIVTGLMSTGGLGQFAARTLTAQTLENISNYALINRIKPLSIPGLPTGQGYVLTISELQAARIGNGVTATNTLGSLFVSTAALGKEVQSWRGVIGAYNNILLVVDPRQPTLIPGGSSAPFSLSAGYMWWDSLDLRQRTNPNVKDTAFLHGAANIVEIEGEKEHMIDNAQDYDFNKGVGIAGVRGYQLPIFTNVNDPISQWSYDRGAVVILDLPNQGAI